MSERRGVFHDTLSTSAFVLLGKSAGFFIPVLIAYLFGVSEKTDLFFFAYSILFCAASTLGEAPRMALPPFVAERSADPSRRDAFMSGLFVQGTLIAAAAAAAIFALLDPALRLLSGFDADSIDVVRRHFASGIPAILFACWASYAAGFLDFHRAFWIPAAAPFLRSALILALIAALSRVFGIRGAMPSYVAGEALLAAILVASAVRVSGLRFKPAWGGRDTLRFFGTAGFQMLATASILLNRVVDRTVASWTGTGSVTMVEYAGALFLVFNVFLGSGFGTVIGSHWASEFHGYKGGGSFHRLAARTAVLSAATAVPFVAAGIIFREPITRLVLARGNFPAERLTELADLFGIQLLALVPAMTALVLKRFFLVLKMTPILTAASLFQLAVNIVCDVAFLKWWGLKGIMIATIAHQAAGAAALIMAFRRTNSGIPR